MQTDEATLRKTVAKNIAQYRKAHHDTQLDLATKLNYSDKSVSKWERGESLPDVYILSQIAELYGVSVSALIGEIQPPRESKPHYHMFILLLSLALTMAVATLLFSMFMICKVDYPAWMFFVYAAGMLDHLHRFHQPLVGHSVAGRVRFGAHLDAGAEPVSVVRTGKRIAHLPRLRGAAGADASLGRLPQISAAQPRASGRGDEAGQPKRMTCSPASTRARTPKGRMQRGSA